MGGGGVYTCVCSDVSPRKSFGHPSPAKGYTQGDTIPSTHAINPLLSAIPHQYTLSIHHPINIPYHMNTPYRHSINPTVRSLTDRKTRLSKVKVGVPLDRVPLDPLTWRPSLPPSAPIASVMIVPKVSITTHLINPISTDNNTL